MEFLAALSPSALLQHSALTIGFIAAIITGLSIIWVKVVRPACRQIRAAVTMIKRVTQAADRLLPFAEHELKSNGGTTIRDQFNRIDGEIAAIATRFKDFTRETLAVQVKTLDAAERATIAANQASRLVDARHTEVTLRLDAIEKRLEPTGEPVPVTIADGPVHVVIEEKGE